MMEHKLVPSSATLSREQVEEYEYDLSDLCSGPHDLGKVNAMAAMARRYRDVLEQEPVAWKERAESAERKLAEAVAALKKLEHTANGVKREDHCVWVQDSDGIWNTSCGHLWEFNDGKPEENNANFCHACGGALLPEHYTDEATK